ncbi:MAG: hypothetical protein WAT79_08290 [Saprospiraceae bacterium]
MDKENDINVMFENLLNVAPKVSVAFCDITYLKSILPYVPEEEFEKIEKLYDFMFKNGMVTGDFMKRYAFLKTVREHKKYFTTVLAMGRTAIICKN